MNWPALHALSLKQGPSSQETLRHPRNPQLLALSSIPTIIPKPQARAPECDEQSTRSTTGKFRVRFPDRVKRFFSSPGRPKPLWGPTNLPTTWRVYFVEIHQPRRENDYNPLHLASRSRTDVPPFPHTYSWMVLPSVLEG